MKISFYVLCKSHFYCSVGVLYGTACRGEGRMGLTTKLESNIPLE